MTEVNTEKTKSGRKIKIRWYYIAVPLVCVVVAAAAVIFIAQPFGGASAESDYLTEAVKRGDLEKTISSSGQLAAASVTNVNAKASGEVATVEVKLGDYVQAGTTLVTLSGGDLETSRDIAKQKLNASKSQRSAANSGLKAAQVSTVQTVAEIMAGNPTPTQAVAEQQVAQQQAQKDRSISSAQAEISNANASVKSAQQDYDKAVAALDNLTIAAPKSGTITALNVAVGDSVTSGSSAGGNGGSGDMSGDGGGSSTALLEISSFDENMAVAIDVTEAEVDSVKVDMDAEVSFDAFPELSAAGKVTAVSPTGSSSGGLVMFSVTVTLSEPDAQLRPGMNATVKIILDSVTDVLLVPNTALSGTEAAGYSVQVLPGGDTSAPAEVRTVELGLANDTYSEVISGLSVGDVVVTGSLSVDTQSGSSGGGFMGGGMGGGMMIRSGGGGPSGDSGGRGSSSGGGGGGPQTQTFP